jgi:hypothetical protein
MSITAGFCAGGVAPGGCRAGGAVVGLAGHGDKRLGGCRGCLLACRLDKVSVPNGCWGGVNTLSIIGAYLHVLDWGWWWSFGCWGRWRGLGRVGGGGGDAAPDLWKAELETSGDTVNMIPAIGDRIWRGLVGSPIVRSSSAAAGRVAGAGSALLGQVFAAPAARNWRRG